MVLPEGLGTLGPVICPKKLKEAFKKIYKGKAGERIVTMVQEDVEKTDPDWASKEYD